MRKQLLPFTARSFSLSELAQDAESLDLVICAVSVESRALKIPRLSKGSHGRKIALRGANEAFELPQSHENVLRSAGFECIDYSENEFRAIVAGSCPSPKMIDERPLRVLVDVSCLPRRILASVIAVLAESNYLSGVDLSLIYNPARYVPPSSGSLEPNRRVAPVHPVFAGWTATPGLPVRTVVGLGYERGKALGAVEYIQASDYLLFLPTSPETRYRKKVEQHNRQLIHAARSNHVYEYDVLRPIETFRILGALVAGMRSEYKPVLMPFGPKILFAVSLLVALVHREVSVWHVSGEELEAPTERPGSSTFATMKVSLVPELNNVGDDADVD